jgi:hypothetical protein
MHSCWTFSLSGSLPEGPLFLLSVLARLVYVGRKRLKCKETRFGQFFYGPSDKNDAGYSYLFGV